MTSQPPATTSPRLPVRGDLITIHDPDYADRNYEVIGIQGPYDSPDDRQLYGHVPGRFITLLVADPANPHGHGWINNVEIHAGQLICYRRHPDLQDRRPDHCNHITITGRTTKPFQLDLFSSE